MVVTLLVLSTLNLDFAVYDYFFLLDIHNYLSKIHQPGDIQYNFMYKTVSKCQCKNENTSNTRVIYILIL